MAVAILLVYALLLSFIVLFSFVQLRLAFAYLNKEKYTPDDATAQLRSASRNYHPIAPV
jgi:hypothetical protein